MNMNGAQLHLLFNHLPVVLVPACLFALVYAHFFKSFEVLKFAAWLTVVTVITAVLANSTGEGAEDVVKKLADNQQELIESHEALADQATIAVYAMGAAAIGLLWSLYKNKNEKLKKVLAIVVFAVGVVAAGLMAVAAHRGGLIRHVEIRAGSSH